MGSSKLDDQDDDFGLMAMIPLEVKEKLFRLKNENKKLKEQITQVTILVSDSIRNILSILVVNPLSSVCCKSKPYTLKVLLDLH